MILIENNHICCLQYQTKMLRGRAQLFLTDLCIQFMMLNAITCIIGGNVQYMMLNAIMYYCRKCTVYDVNAVTCIFGVNLHYMMLNAVTCIIVGNV